MLYHRLVRLGAIQGYTLQLMGSALHRSEPVHDSRLAGRIVHCAHFEAPYPGSFIPMLIGATVAARDRGYETTI